MLFTKNSLTNRYISTDVVPELKLKEYEDFIQLLQNYQGSPEETGLTEIGSPMERRSNGFRFGRPYGLVTRNLGPGNIFQRRNFYGGGAQGYFTDLGGSSLMERLLNYGDGSAHSGGISEASNRYEDFVRERELNSGAHYLRNLDPIGGGNLVKKNLDHIGGPNLIKKTLDSLGGGNLVRRSDSIVGAKFARSLDSIGGGNLV